MHWRTMSCVSSASRINIVSAWQSTITSDDDNDGKTVETELECASAEEGGAIIRASVVLMPPTLLGADNNATATTNKAARLREVF